MSATDQPLCEFEPAPAHRQLQRLDRLAEAGLRIAIALERRAEAAVEAPADAPVDLEAIARAYARVARGVRLATLLHAKLTGELQAAAVQRARSEERELLVREEVEKERAARIVRRVIRAEHDDADRIESLAAEAVERLDDDDLYGACLMRPLSDMVADICKDLGLKPDWDALSQEPWATEEIASGLIGTPFERLELARPPPSLTGEVAQRAGGGIPPPHPSISCLQHSGPVQPQKPILTS